MQENPDRPNKEAIFNQACEIEGDSERAAFIAKSCGDDKALKAEIEQLLELDNQQDSLLDFELTNLDQTSDSFPILEKTGDEIGPFKLLQKVGEGGMGVVYMAEQKEPIRRRVALKIIKPGMDTREVVARFEAERQALAMMDHPNIAKVLDCGATKTGRPYFVMELVKGVSITKYCDANHLTPKERLELFVPVCQAIQHAHQKGIIHRDIKPSNILIAEYDHTPVPKIIDFGVAKALNQQLTKKTMFTQLGQIIGTIEYMSPEQARVNQLDIDTRSDIYSLGVLLYELLSGSTPFDKKRMRSVAIDELMRIIREEDPPRPSTRLSTIETLPSIAANRKTEPKKLSTLLHGELDWIVMKAMEKDRGRRYDTASAFADDIQNYLNDEAVLACPPSAAYQFQKFVRRNRGPMTAAAVAAAALLVVAIGSIITAGRFRNLAQRNAKLLTQSVEAEATAREARQESEEARDQEQGLRAEAEHQTGIAQQQTQRANDALEDAQQQRQRAEENEAIAEEREVLARRNLYTAHMNLARDAFDGLDVPRVLDLLERHVPAPGEQDWRSFEWYYLLGQCNRDELTINCRHSYSRPTFSPDGKTLAAAIAGTGVQLWDMDQLKRILVLKNGAVRGPVAFSPDGKMLAFLAGGEIKLWDLEKKERIRNFGEHKHQTFGLAFTPDGKRLVSTDGGHLDTKTVPGVVRVWDIETGELLRELRGHDKFIYSMALSPDGERLVTAGQDAIRFWNLLSGEQIETLDVPRRGRALAVAWSAPGNLVATFYDENIVILDGSTGQEVRRFDSPKVFSLDFSPDGKSLASAHFDSTVRLWNVDTGAELDVFQGHSQWVFYVTFSPDGKRIASVARNSQIKVWPVGELDSRFIRNGNFPRKKEKSLGRDRMQLSADGKRLATVQDPKTVTILDVETGQVDTQLSVGGNVHALDFSADAKQVAVAFPSGIQIWDLQTSELLREKTCKSTVWTLDFSPDGRQLAVGTDARQVEIYEAPSLTRIHVLPWLYSTPLRKIMFSPDGKLLAVSGSAEPRETHLWDVSSWQLLSSLEYVDRWGMDLSFSFDGRLLAVSEGSNFLPRDGAVTRLIDTSAGREFAALTGDDEYHTAVAFSSNGSTLVTGTEQGKITVWDLDTREERATFQWEGHSIESLALSADGRTLVSGDSQSGVRIWRAASQRHVDRCEFGGLYRRATEYAGDGRWQEAAGLYSWLLERQEDVNVRRRRAQCFAELGRWEDSIADAKKVAEAYQPASKNSFRPWYEISIAHLAGRDAAGYRETCAAMLDRYRETNDPITAEFVCWTHALSPQADLDWGQLVALAAVPFYDGEPGAAPHRTMGAVLYRAGLHHQALDALENSMKVIEQEQNRTSLDYSWYLLAMVHASLGNSEEARDYFSRATPLPDGKHSGDIQGDSQQRQDWFRRATLRLLREEAKTELLGTAGHDARPRAQVEESEQALRILSQATELRDDIPKLWRMRAEVNELLGREEEAAADLARAEQLQIDLPLRRLNRLISGQSGGDVTDRQPIFYDRALHYFEVRRDYDSAIQDCYAVLRTSPRNRRAFQLLLKAHSARGTLDKAEEGWERDVGDPTEFYNARAEYYRNNEQFDLEIADLTHAIELDAENANFYRQRGDALIRLQRWDEALSDLNEAIRISPGNTWGYQVRSRIHRELNQVEAAEADAHKAIELDQHNRWAWLDLAKAHELQQEWTSAAEAYEKFFNLHPDNSNYWLPYANALIASDQLEEYRVFCTKLVEQFGGTEDPKLAVQIIFCLNKAPDAVEDWTVPIRLAELVLKSADPQKNRVAALFGRAGHYQRSIELRKQEAIDANRDLNAWDCLRLALAHHGLGDVEQARDFLAQSEKLAAETMALTEDPNYQRLHREVSELLASKTTPPKQEKRPVTQTVNSEEDPEK